MSELNNIALKILSNGKGILAADESTGTMTKRLESVNVSSTSKNSSTSGNYHEFLKFRDNSGNVSTKKLRFQLIFCQISTLFWEKSGKITLIFAA